MAANHGYVASFDIEPFTNYGRFATDSAYPHSDSPIPVSYQSPPPSVHKSVLTGSATAQPLLFLGL